MTNSRQFVTKNEKINQKPYFSLRLMNGQDQQKLWKEVVMMSLNQEKVTEKKSLKVCLVFEWSFFEDS